MFSSDEWRCHAMLRHPVVSHHMPLDWTLAKTTLEWKRRLFRRRHRYTRANLISNSYTCDLLLPHRLLLFCSQRVPQFLLLRAFSATWKTPIGLPRQGPSGEALIGAQQEISENSGFGVSAASSGKHWNTSATSDTDILKVWHVYKTKKGEKNRFIQRGLQTCSVPFSMPWTRSSMSTASGANYFHPKWLPRGTSLPSTLVQQLFITPH